MKSKKIMEIITEKFSKKEILEKIVKYINHRSDFFHIVSLNAENLVVAQKNDEFNKVLNTADIKLIDGVGIVLAGRILGVDVGDRITGVELMEEMMKIANKRSLRVLLIGGRPNLALKLTSCYQKKYPKASITGLEGIKDINKPTINEEKYIFSIVTGIRPHFVFTAFGSPYQELWLFKNKDKLKGAVCMGVGGAFDYLSGEIPRAPLLIRKIGLEWLYKLITQPWRWKRQIRLFKFLWLVMKEKLTN